MQLSAEIGNDVEVIYGRGLTDAQRRRSNQIDSLCTSGQMTGALRIPDTAGDLQLLADLRARRLSAFVDVHAPQDRGARGRVSWLVGQIGEAPADLVVECFAKNARLSTSATLAETREDRLAPLGEDRSEPHRFRLITRAEMGMGRKRGGRNSGFIDTVLDLVTHFYGSVVQQITPWQRPAPKLTKESTPVEPDQKDEVVEVDTFSWQQPHPWTDIQR